MMIHSLLILLAVLLVSSFFLRQILEKQEEIKRENKKEWQKKPEIFPRFFFFLYMSLKMYENKIYKNPIIDTYRQQLIVASLIANIIVTITEPSVR